MKESCEADVGASEGNPVPYIPRGHGVELYCLYCSPLFLVDVDTKRGKQRELILEHCLLF